MKILVVNPNSDPEMTAAIQRTAEDFAGSHFEVVCLPTPGAPHFIETYEDEIKAAPGMIELVRKNEDRYDAFVSACHDDPHLDVLKEITKKPVVGIGEASMKMATLLGHRFSVIQTTEHSIPIKESLVWKYHLQDLLASIRAPREDAQGLADAEKLFQAARAAVEEDRAEVIVLGCAGMTGLDKQMQKELGVPVLDGVVCGLILASGLVKYGVSTSKARKYTPP
jgi:allantoin racemase